ncbi:hypothetical protein DFO50_101630 [Microvirgula sp. AG722]|nr:hypothetical protein DFO50_101630 [Microvirgula sp. AG722]
MTSPIPSPSPSLPVPNERLAAALEAARQAALAFRNLARV